MWKHFSPLKAGKTDQPIKFVHRLKTEKSFLHQDQERIRGVMEMFITMSDLPDDWLKSVLLKKGKILVYSIKWKYRAEQVKRDPKAKREMVDMDQQDQKDNREIRVRGDHRDRKERREGMEKQEAKEKKAERDRKETMEASVNKDPKEQV